MKGKIFAVKTFLNENEMLNFINNDDNKEPISVIFHEGHTYSLYYLW